VNGNTNAPKPHTFGPLVLPFSFSEKTFVSQIRWLTGLNWLVFAPYLKTKQQQQPQQNINPQQKSQRQKLHTHTHTQRSKHSDRRLPTLPAAPVL